MRDEKVVFCCSVVLCCGRMSSLRDVSFFLTLENWVTAVKERESESFSLHVGGADVLTSQRWFFFV